MSEEARSPARPPVRRSGKGGLSDWPGGIVPGTSCSALPSSMVDDSTGNLNKKCRAEGNSPSLSWYMWVVGVGGGACIQPEAKIK